MKRLVKGEWYEFEGFVECLLQYNGSDYAKGWWNGRYGDNYKFKGLSSIAKPASEIMLKKYGVIKEMKEKKKLNFNWIYLLGGVLALIMSAVSLFKSDFIDAKLNLILCILFANLYKNSVLNVNITYDKDLVIKIERDKIRNN